MLGKTKEGIQHYELREKDWTPVDGLLSHNWLIPLKTCIKA